MKIRRPPRRVLLLWILMAVLLIAGLLVGYIASRPIGIALFAIGLLGYMFGGVLIFFVFPRR
jgi:hypothetical protein